MPATTLAYQRFRYVTTFVAILAQWPLAATLFSTGEGSLTRTDYLGLCATVAGLALWLVALRGQVVSLLIILGSFALAAGAYLCMRGTSLNAWLGFCVLLGLLTTASLAFIQPGVAAKITLALTILLIGGMIGETVTGRGWLQHSQSISTGSFTGQIEGPDRQAFAQLLPLSSARARKTKSDGSLDFDVRYHTDAVASRVVPGRPDQGPDIFLFGCSFTFGEGLEDDQTLAARLQSLRSSDRIYNFGIRNAGTSDAWIHLKRKLEAGARPQRCVYLFMDDHFRRTGLPDVTVATQPARPRFILRDSQPVLMGRAGDTFSSPLEAFRVNLARRSHIYRSLASRWVPDERVTDLIAGLGDAMNRECQSHGVKFLFVIFASDGSRFDVPIDRIKTKLEATGVSVLDSRPLLSEHMTRTGMTSNQLFFADSHPRPEYARLIASWIDKKLSDETAQPVDAKQ